LRLQSPYSIHSVTMEGLVAANFAYDLRMPMLDSDLVRFVCGVPGHYVTPGGRSRGLLRDALLSTLPERLRLRWSKGDGVGVASAALSQEFLSSRISSLTDLIDPGLSSFSEIAC